MAMYIFCSYNYVKKITFGPWPTKNGHGQICPWPTKSGHGQCGFAHGQCKCSHGQVFMAMAILITLKWAMAIKFEVDILCTIEKEKKVENYRKGRLKAFGKTYRI